MKRISWYEIIDTVSFYFPIAWWYYNISKVGIYKSIWLHQRDRPTVCPTFTRFTKRAENYPRTVDT